MRIVCAKQLLHQGVPADAIEPHPSPHWILYRKLIALPLILQAGHFIQEDVRIAVAWEILYMYIADQL